MDLREQLLKILRAEAQARDITEEQFLRYKATINQVKIDKIFYKLADLLLPSQYYDTGPIELFDAIDVTESIQRIPEANAYNKCLTDGVNITDVRRAFIMLSHVGFVEFDSQDDLLEGRQVEFTDEFIEFLLEWHLGRSV